MGELMPSDVRRKAETRLLSMDVGDAQRVGGNFHGAPMAGATPGSDGGKSTRNRSRGGAGAGGSYGSGSCGGAGPNVPCAKTRLSTKGCRGGFSGGGTRAGPT